MQSRHGKGFTLIELLVALAVVVVALAAVQRTTMQAVENTEAMQLASFAHWIAADRLTELRVRDEWPAPGERRGALEFAEQKWHWERSVRATDDPRLREVEVAVRLEKDPRESARARLVGFLMQPEGSGGNSGTPRQ